MKAKAMQSKCKKLRNKINNRVASCQANSILTEDEEVQGLSDLPPVKEMTAEQAAADRKIKQYFSSAAWYMELHRLGIPACNQRF